ncbi:hypothetical protein [Pedobacter metabolipauper]|nr:hypothetical protein [Pedobacter metabolipauper]
MNRVNAILFITVLIFASCRGKGNNNDHKITGDSAVTNTKQNDTLLKEVLTAQLADGKETGGDEYESHQYTEKDLQAIVPIVRHELEKSGYIFPAKEEFNAAIQRIFKRTVSNSISKQLYVDFNDACAKEPIYSRVKVIANGLYVIKNNYFITELYAIPELLDYQSKFPELNQIEDLKILKKNPDLGNSMEIPHWKDITDLKEQRKMNIQRLVAQNSYLFNASKTHGAWLRKNEPEFMTALVKTFGYTDDPELLKWVLEASSLKAGDEDDFGKLIWMKNCDQSISIHSKTFEVINSMNEAEKTKYLNDLNAYLNYFLDYEKKPFNINNAQKSKIIACLVNFGERFRYQNGAKSDDLKFMGRVYLRDYNDIYKNEFKRNKYYNLPEFQVRFEKAKDYWEELVPENDGEQE